MMNYELPATQDCRRIHRENAKETLQNLFAKALRATDFQRFSSIY